MDYGKNKPCCRTATEQERREHPERYNCETCEYRIKHQGLWLENAEALDLYRALGTRVLGGEGVAWLVDRWTAGWALDDVLALLERLDLIHDTLSPDTSRHG